MAAPFERGVQPRLEDGDPFVLGDEAGREDEHVGVVVLTRQLGDLGGPGHRGADTAGEASFRGLSTGSYVVHVRARDCISQQVPVEVRAAEEPKILNLMDALKKSVAEAQAGTKMAPSAKSSDAKAAKMTRRKKGG